METKKKKRLDLDEVRAKLAGTTGPKYWRGLEEVADTEEFSNWLEDEFPNRSTLLQIDRRTMLKFMGASMAFAGLSGCRSVFMEEERIVPYVKQPEEMVLGKPLFFATAMPFNGYGIGCLVESREGRPIKIEGNPDHPESLGASNSFMQAAILNMYDPDRSQNPVYDGEVSTWDVFLAELRASLEKQRASGGGGFRILTEVIASPTLRDQINVLLKSYPNAKWVQYDPADNDAAKQASFTAFGGRVFNTIYDLKKAKVVVSIDSDLLLDMPGSLRYSRDFMDGRRVMGDNTAMNRLYAIESMPTTTGATADHRYPVRASDIELVVAALAAAVGVPNIQTAATAVAPDVIAAIAKDLSANQGAAVLIPGHHQSVAVHLLCHAINSQIGAMGSTALLVPAMDDVPNQLAAFRDLVSEMSAGRVDTLLMIGGNPVYNAPTDLNFSQALKNVRMRVHHAHYYDETGRECNWHVPLTHFLEEWSDVRAYDGTISIVQPLIAPLFDSKSAHELLGALTTGEQDGYKILQEGYRAKGLLKGDFQKAWNRALHDGAVPKTAFAPVAATYSAGRLQDFLLHQPLGKMELVIKPDPTVHDGRFANNGWLQELPKPITKITWENAFFMSPRTAQENNLSSEDGLEVTVGAQSATGPVWVLPGHPDNSITVHLGYGRTNIGAVANGVGFNAYALRRSDGMSFTGDVQIRKIGTQSHPVASTQIHHSMEGRDIARVGSIEQYHENKSLKDESEPEGPVNSTRPDQTVENQSMYPDEIFNYDGPQWGMTIDLNTCTGCNACVTACQAENNIPVVGKEQVKRGREMHWIRIDRYYTARRDWDTTKTHMSSTSLSDDPIANPDYIFQPLMCVHCEKAPCEPVCPVGATMHSHEGLNQMVYNRCVGTRYCSNNCPYKVRRFNYLNYSDNQTQFVANDEANRTRVPLLRLLNNPDVTVRGRGVMEKCTYCVQRINDARIEGKKQGRDPKDGEIITACQQACPTKTIVFGNIADKEAAVTKIRHDPRAYALLEELQTRPRTAYLGKIRNPNPEIKA